MKKCPHHPSYKQSLSNTELQFKSLKFQEQYKSATIRPKIPDLNKRKNVLKYIHKMLKLIQ